jgi:hypothetical protein
VDSLTGFVQTMPLEVQCETTEAKDGWDLIIGS